MTTLLPILPAAIAGASVYAAALSFISIQDVRTYEEKAKKAAKYSNTAEDQLNSTLYTEASGVFATFLSLATSLSLTIAAFTTTQPYPWLSIISSAACAGTAFFSSGYIHSFWRGKAKVPFVRKYNDAITVTNNLRKLLGLLAIAWSVQTAIRAVGILN